MHAFQSDMIVLAVTIVSIQFNLGGVMLLSLFIDTGFIKKTCFCVTDILEKYITFRLCFATTLRPYLERLLFYYDWLQ
jgi:hypothetical protein